MRNRAQIESAYQVLQYIRQIYTEYHTSINKYSP